MKALCPNCGEAEGERTARGRGSDAGIEVTFSCPECDHVWSIGL
ncbi:hypothetical protein [Halosimplex rubrum]|nr:hypothetical protein [Halosimplex rubrum]